MPNRVDYQILQECTTEFDFLGVMQEFGYSDFDIYVMIIGFRKLTLSSYHNGPDGKVRWGKI